jgi:hypothetical protein
MHVPCVLPSAATQVDPEQQSASTLHAWPAAAQLDARQTYGGVPDGLGTQGVPSQQFALDAHDPPAATHTPAQRGTPFRSGLHVSWSWQFPLQQSQLRLQVSVVSLHKSPSGTHPMGALQEPIVAGGVMAHVAGVPLPPGRLAAPQQSLSCVHTSPVAWQPLAGWQIGTPVGAYGAQSPLQQFAPQVNGALHTVPSVPEHVAPVGNDEHVPRVAPVAMLHVPLQQSDAPVHTSPTCWQYEDTEHVPPWHSSEQQSLFCAQALPSVRQALSAAHVPPVQVPLQHEASVEQGWLSEMQLGNSQTPPVHTWSQQSLAAAQGAPRDKHGPDVVVVVVVLVVVVVDVGPRPFTMSLTQLSTTPSMPTSSVVV